ncbi:efflux transporter outer membrane subunit [Emcibacter sp.]|uniref:efflux transporter outer membrane subunit n=1 Tax=Emcibacter sp. TaxID=1979954 RepID=UPI003A94A041
MRIMRSLLFSASALALTACASGPDYVVPLPSKALSGPFQTSSAAVDITAPAADSWWQLYDDPVLDQLIADALAANTDIRVAAARVARARALLRGEGSNRLPQTDIGASADYRRTSTADAGAGAEREDWRFDAGLNVAYEVDLFGRINRSIEAARGDLAATQADADAVRVAVVAETARAYADAASAAERLSVAEHIVALLDDSVSITRKRTLEGLAEELDAARITALRDQRRAEIPAIAAERQAALLRLATLTGRTPESLPTIAATRVTTLRLDRPIPVGNGTELLARRPDIRAAERRLAAATARIGVSTAELYPRISLGGGIGSTSANVEDMFTSSAFRWAIGPFVSWSFPNQEAARARIAAARADSQAALAEFDGTVLQAIEEVEGALSNYTRLLERRAHLQSARDQAQIAVNITRAQQREGQIDGLTTLDAERSFAETQADLALADARITDAQIDLFRALGGNWRQS